MAEKTLMFHESFKTDILRGDKKFSIRRYKEYKHNLNQGDTLWAEFMDESPRIKLVATEDTLVCKAKDAPVEVLEEAGFESLNNFMDGMYKYYDDFNEDSLMCIIRFEIA